VEQAPGQAQRVQLPDRPIDRGLVERSMPWADSSAAICLAGECLKASSKASVNLGRKVSTAWMTGSIHSGSTRWQRLALRQDLQHAVEEGELRGCGKAPEGGQRGQAVRRRAAGAAHHLHVELVLGHRIEPRVTEPAARPILDREHVRQVGEGAGVAHQPVRRPQLPHGALRADRLSPAGRTTATLGHPEKAMTTG
jgi:hypothetical protein